jgi:hypothetical protein
MTARGIPPRPSQWPTPASPPPAVDTPTDRTARAWRHAHPSGWRLVPLLSFTGVLGALVVLYLWLGGWPGAVAHGLHVVATWLTPLWHWLRG